MSASLETLNFESRYGVIYRAYLQDGEGFTGRAKKAARQLNDEQEERDEELFGTSGGIEKVRRRLLAKWYDESQSLARLTLAEDRLLIMTALDEARLASVKIVYIDAKIGHGLFATRQIRANEFIGEYTGVLRVPRLGDEHNRYLAGTMAYGDLDDFLIDGESEGNLTRFINHSFNAPNVRSEHAFYDLRWHRILRADRDIKTEEQLLWNYGQDYWRTREAPAEVSAST